MNQMLALSTRRIAREIALVGSLVALTVVCAKISIPLPGTPVPATLQTAAVIFAGAAAGSLRGFLAQFVYLFLGFIGLPVFAGKAAGPGIIISPTFGYLAAFPLAATIVGSTDSGLRKWLAAAGAMALIYIMGAGWLWLSYTDDLYRTLRAGVLPFLFFDSLKTIVALKTGGMVRKLVLQ